MKGHAGAPAALLLMLLVRPCVFAATFVVAQERGDDASGAGTAARPWKTIGRGLQALASGDTLEIEDGIYPERLCGLPSGTRWSGATTLRSKPGHRVLVQPESRDFVLNLTRPCGAPHHVVIDGLILDGRHAALEVVKISDGAHHVRIQNSEIRGSPGRSCILIANGKTGRQSTHNKLVNLDVHSCGLTSGGSRAHGIYVSASHNTIEKCRVHGNSGFGIHVYNGHTDCAPGDERRCQASGNVVRYNDVRENVAGSGIILSTGVGNVAHHNCAELNGEYGIRIDIRARRTYVYENEVCGNALGGIHVGSIGPPEGTILDRNTTCASAPVQAPIVNGGRGRRPDTGRGGTCGNGMSASSVQD